MDGMDLIEKIFVVGFLIPMAIAIWIAIGALVIEVFNVIFKGDE